jgi:hypothetical protein
MRVRTAIVESFFDPEAWVEVHQWAQDEDAGPHQGVPIAPPDSIVRIGPFPSREAAYAFCTGPLRDGLQRGLDQVHREDRPWPELERAGVTFTRRGRRD